MANEEQQAPPCDDSAYRAFDFWIGAWEVRTASGELAGHNTITAIANCCALREEWRGIRGLVGTSLSTYSPARQAWHQTWVDSSGTLLLLDGGLHDGVMVLEGDAPLPGVGEGVLRHRISWSVVDGNADHVRQHWETSEDGARWETAFDGHYHRRR